MSKKICERMTTQLGIVNSLKAEFDEQFLSGNTKKSVLLKKDISGLIAELMQEIWPLETLNFKEIERQYKEWQEMYQDLDSQYKLPSQDRLREFLQKDRDFMELMKTKEKQGFFKMILAPAPGFYSLEDFLEKVVDKTNSVGGLGSYKSSLWESLLQDEGVVQYFGKISSFVVGGVRGAEIRQEPEKFGICDGWMISFTDGEQHLMDGDGPDLDTGEGRMAIKTGLSPTDYAERYFSDKDKHYLGEEAMIPHEYFALLAQNVFEIYIKNKEQIVEEDTAFMDSKNGVYTWFISTTVPKLAHLPGARWSSMATKLALNDYNRVEESRSLGVRSVVRRKPRD